MKSHRLIEQDRKAAKGQLLVANRPIRAPRKTQVHIIESSSYLFQFRCVNLKYSNDSRLYYVARNS